MPSIVCAGILWFTMETDGKERENHQLKRPNEEAKQRRVLKLRGEANAKEIVNDGHVNRRRFCRGGTIS